MESTLTPLSSTLPFLQDKKIENQKTNEIPHLRYSGGSTTAKERYAHQQIPYRTVTRGEEASELIGYPQHNCKRTDRRDERLEGADQSSALLASKRTAFQSQRDHARGGTLIRGTAGS